MREQTRKCLNAILAYLIPLGLAMGGVLGICMTGWGMAESSMTPDMESSMLGWMVMSLTCAWSIVPIVYLADDVDEGTRKWLFGRKNKELAAALEQQKLLSGEVCALPATIPALESSPIVDALEQIRERSSQIRARDNVSDSVMRELTRWESVVAEMANQYAELESAPVKSARHQELMESIENTLSKVPGELDALLDSTYETKRLAAEATNQLLSDMLMRNAAARRTPMSLMR